MIASNLLLSILLGFFQVANPTWTAEYNYGQTPEANGFTRTLYGSPVINLVTGGTPSNRRVEITSNAGDAVFITSNLPSLDPAIGATAEFIASVTGAGDAGVELTFLSRQILVMLFAAKVQITSPGGINEEVATAPNSVDTTIRIVYSPSNGGEVSVYRNGVLIIGPLSVAASNYPITRVLWWGEGGGTQIFKAMRYYQGGGVAP